MLPLNQWDVTTEAAIWKMLWVSLALQMETNEQTKRINEKPLT